MKIEHIVTTFSDFSEAQLAEIRKYLKDAIVLDRKNEIWDDLNYTLRGFMLNQLNFFKQKHIIKLSLNFKAIPQYFGDIHTWGYFDVKDRNDFYNFLIQLQNVESEAI